MAWTNLMSNEHHFSPTTMTSSYSSMPSLMSPYGNNMVDMDLGLNYDELRFNMNFPSPSVSTAMSSAGWLTPPLSSPDPDGQIDDAFAMDCTLPDGMAAKNGTKRRRMQNREAQRRFRARKEQLTNDLQKELDDLRTENRTLLERYNQKVGEVSRLNDEITEMNNKMKEMRADMTVRPPRRSILRLRPAKIVLPSSCRKAGNSEHEDDHFSDYDAVLELVPIDQHHSEHSCHRESVEQVPASARTGDETATIRSMNE